MPSLDASTPRLFSLIEDLRGRAAEAAIGRSRIVRDPLREYLRSVLARPPGTPGSLLADPVFEGAFGYQEAQRTTDELVQDGLLHPRTAAALAVKEPLDPDERGGRNDWSGQRRPYTHQHQAWTVLAAEPPRGAVVSAGTGSGKTEAFLVPILDALVRESETAGCLTGVRALLLYPLNALIASQRDRLADWTAPLGGDVRFCLYNGETPPSRSAAERRAKPYEVRDRAALRADPPPVLVTNATMLEYMLVRTDDAPILNASRGRLRWIVLDEAHTYLGSQAAEMTLLLRRTLDAFGVAPDEVRFIATSATLGHGAEAERQLRRFLAGLAGMDESRIDVVTGSRYVPPLDGDFGGLTASPAAQRLRETLAEGPATLGRLQAAQPEAPVCDLLERGIMPSGPNGAAFLPLRLHLFHRAQSGMFACLDPVCTGRQGTRLDHLDWPYGKVFERDRERCDACAARTLEILLCDDCGAPFLEAGLDAGERQLDRWREEQSLDEFALEADEDGDEGEDEDASAPPLQHVLLAPAGTADGARVLVEPQTGRLRDAQGDGTTEYMRFGLDLCPCCGAGASRRRLFRPLRLGGPFFVGTAGNVLLNAAPPKAGANVRLPHDGRQLITFTDNRQGTARFAASWQLEAERNWVRARIWHKLQGREEGDADGLEKEIAALEKLPPALLDGPLAERLANLRRQRGAATGGKPIPWRDMRDHLSALDSQEDELRELWREREDRFGDSRELATLQLFTEFLRRPMRANSLETMGLAALRFPQIARQTEAFLPRLFQERGASLADWHDYLHLVLTFFVRANSAVQLDRGLAHWTGQRIYARTFLPWNVTRDTTPREQRWPRLYGTAGRTARPVLMLRDGLGLDLDDPVVREAVNDTLDAAWRAIIPVGQPGLPDGAFSLDLSKAELIPVTDLWLCPVTTRLMEGTFRGITPYVTRNPQSRDSLLCERLEAPRLPRPFLRGLDGSDARAEVVTWLRDDPAVNALRGRGLWTDIADRLALLAPFARIVEHSAQQPSWRLRDYERAFKAGRVNVLNCSTTMEMGVDIGGISTVAMTNVPPSPASYRQRVGRAGRRGEALSMAFTYCPDSPVGWHAFDRPGEPLRQEIAPPRVALDSRVLVQRHVNAYLLAAYLRLRGTELHRLTAGAFFDPGAADGAPWARFALWLETVALSDIRLREGIERLTCGTGLAGLADTPAYTASALRSIARPWIEEREQIAADLDAAAPGAAKRAIEIQAERMDGEYLLGELVRQAFLPGHGFPTDVVPFVVPPPSAARTREREEKRDDVRSARRSPTRTLDVAIREYAPGADVVLDGIVYRSGGVTLNWKRPATDEAASEIQAIRWFWRCEACGAAGDGIRQPQACPGCGSAKVERHRALRPAGFAVDPDAPVTNAVEYVDFVPPPRPLVSAAGAPWVALSNPNIGRFRRSPDGVVMAMSRGTHGHGYAVCLSCGRAAAETDGPGPALPPARSLVGHRPLRKRRETMRCDGNDRAFSIQRHLAFGFSRRTEVFELQLADMPGEDVALTLAVALREALCRRIGIERDEVACDAGYAGDGEVCSIWLFDTAAGGAGYAAATTVDVAGLLRDARGALECSNSGCERACPACLILRDTARFSGRLDRKAAATWLDTITNRLDLPPEARVFGTEVPQHMAVEPLPAELARAARTVPGAVTTLFLHGPAAGWSLARWWGTVAIERLTRAGYPVVLLAEPDVLRHLSFDEVLELRALCDRAGKRLCIASWNAAPAPTQLLATIAGSTTEGWATSGNPLDAFSADPPVAVIRAALPAAPEIGTPFDPSSRVRVLQPTAHRLTIGHQLDGDVERFGRKFWQLLHANAGIASMLAGCGSVRRVIYSDRYLLSPLVVRLLQAVLAELRRIQGAKAAGSLPVVLETMSVQQGRHGGFPCYLQHDWTDSAARDSILVSSFSKMGLSVTLRTGSRTSVAHARTLRLVGETRTVEVLLDQGLGHWKPVRRVPFDFSARSQEQASKLMLAKFAVGCEAGRTTEIFVGASSTSATSATE